MKYLFIIALFTLSLISNEAIRVDNEYKVDLYYANSILVVYASQDEARADWRDNVDDLTQKFPELKERIENMEVVYNRSASLTVDVFETFLQKSHLEPSYKIVWELFQLAFARYLKSTKRSDIGWGIDQLEASMELEIKQINEKQINAYKKSIRQGHGVVAVGHGQGNLFITEAFNKLGEVGEGEHKGWMQKYFHTIALGTPAQKIINGGRGFTFDNDYMLYFPFSNKSVVQENPNRHSTLTPVEGEIDEVRFDRKSLKYHEFEYYLGDSVVEEDFINFTDKSTKEFYNYLKSLDSLYPLIASNQLVTERKERQTTKARVLIEEWLRQEIMLQDIRDSQWLIDTNRSVDKVEKECFTSMQDSCPDKLKYITHRFKDRELNENMVEDKVYLFDEGGKVYKVCDKDAEIDDNGKCDDSDRKYIINTFGATKFVNSSDSGVCYELDDGNKILGKPESNVSTNPTTIKGTIEADLSWDYVEDIDMDLTISGSSYVEYDLKDIDGLGREHAYIANLGDIYPGDIYTVISQGTLREGKDINDSCFEKYPLNIYAVVKTPTESKFKQYEIRSKAQMNFDIAQILVESDQIAPSFLPNPTEVTGTVFSSSVVVQRVYDECSEGNKLSSCGCVPCKFIIRGMDNAVEMGPIAGASVEIVQADTYGSSSPIVAYVGKTTSDNDLFKSGLIKFTSSDLDKFEDDAYYVVSARGGSDLDRNDDLVRDATTTPNNGTIHAIIKGSDLKTMPFRVNILTEASYQVSGDLLGSNYDHAKLSQRLDDIATKLFKKKTFIYNNEYGINYHDILLWAPATDKSNLYKEYDVFVEPIVEKVYSDSERFKESYTLIYDEINSDVPRIAPLALTIAQNTPNSTIIGQINIVDTGKLELSHIELTGKGSERFSIDQDGFVWLVDNTDLIESAKFQLIMKPVATNGEEGIEVALVVSIDAPNPIYEDPSTLPVLKKLEVNSIDENAPMGTVAAKVTYTNAAQYILSGEDAAHFSINARGVISVGDGANIDYEKQSIYNIAVAVQNSNGYRLPTIPIAININNAIDTPLYELTKFINVDENIAVGALIGTITRVRDGASPIDAIDILNPNVPFSIDRDGNIYSTQRLDYETTDYYALVAKAKSATGESNKIEININVINAIEVDIPKLQDGVFRVEENAPIGTIVGQAMIDDAGFEIDRIQLSGIGSSHFSIDTDGTIRVAGEIDYESLNYYTFILQASNANGIGNSAKVTIEIEDIVREGDVPTLQSTSFTSIQKPTANLVIGKIKIADDGHSTITTMRLSGEDADDFSIESDGTIRVAHDLTYTHKTYHLKAYASNQFGESEAVNISIMLMNNGKRAFITKWKTDNEGDTEDNQIYITVNTGYLFNYSVDWGDSTIEHNITGHALHTYDTPGTYTVKITGKFPAIELRDYWWIPLSNNSDKLLSVEQWGDNEWLSMNNAFSGCTNLEIHANDAPNLQNVTNMAGMFWEATNFNSDISSWDVSSVKDMYRLFDGASSFNQNIGNWDVSNVQNMLTMFASASNFNQDISGWNVSNVTNMYRMFFNADSFNKNINSWNVSNVTDMFGMFENTDSFNQPLNSWDISKVTNMGFMFTRTKSFNQPLDKWEVSNITNMDALFHQAISFNQDISGWNVSNVTSMHAMFWGATNFNQDISNWDVSKVTNMEFMFKQATNFNSDISNWDVSNVTDMQYMFWKAYSFNQDISLWNVSNVTNMYGMFYYATSFSNQNLSGWNVLNVSNHNYFITGAGSGNSEPIWNE